MLLQRSLAVICAVSLCMLSTCLFSFNVLHLRSSDVFLLHSATFPADNKSSRIAVATPPNSCKSSVDTSRNDELSAFLRTLRTKGREKNGPGYEVRFGVLHNFSESQIDKFVRSFGITYINSLSFKQQFLVCGGQTLAKQQENALEGKVVLPKHFQDCKTIVTLLYLVLHTCNVIM